MVVLREFLYRRDDLVAQFLAQLEGGIYDEEQITEQDQSTSGIGGSLGAGRSTVSGERKKQGGREAARTVRQTHESRFNRLYSLLEDSEAVQLLSALDDNIWNQLHRNEILEVEALLTLAPGVEELNSFAAIDAAGPLLALMRNLPEEVLPDGFDRKEADKISAQLPVVQDLAGHFAEAPVPCTFAPVGSPRYRFFCELSRAFLLVQPGEIEGDVTVLAKVQRFVAKGKPEVLGSGLLRGIAVNREQRRMQKTDEPLTVRLSHPAAVVTVVAIYR